MHGHVDVKFGNTSTLQLAHVTSKFIGFRHTKRKRCQGSKMVKQNASFLASFLQLSHLYYRKVYKWFLYCPSLLPPVLHVKVQNLQS